MGGCQVQVRSSGTAQDRFSYTTVYVAAKEILDTCQGIMGVVMPFSFGGSMNIGLKGFKVEVSGYSPPYEDGTSLAVSTAIPTALASASATVPATPATAIQTSLEAPPGLSCTTDVARRHQVSNAICTALFNDINAEPGSLDRKTWPPVGKLWQWKGCKLFLSSRYSVPDTFSLVDITRVGKGILSACEGTAGLVPPLSLGGEARIGIVGFYVGVMGAAGPREPGNGTVMEAGAAGGS